MKNIILIGLCFFVSNQLQSQSVKITSGATEGKYLITYANGNNTGKLIKTVIFTEGLHDFENLDFTENTGYDILLSELSNHGYDVVRLDFKNIQLGIATNAALIQKLLELLEPQKLFPDLPVAIIALGPSGLMAHHALKKMDNSNKPHYVSNVYSIDTPYQGMQIPVSLELFISERGTTGYPHTENNKETSLRKWEKLFNVSST